ncbi:transcriptional regulator [Weizmannia acidilactici]|uniref:Transcriptional regulator n=1 Tax=Weizmannia acidilactici TaxID=2607726 RepID=A0A5J4JQT2_9BACI|nr:helix-turn-helix domain-containing protein [Weizmannia acidilactici]GER68359.1 transcriptional regulator [Weizmannia acidilactici]GER71464.1 transcriptional regulator [Weizmannia acidilactici]GER72774.1 transcriptional regulator [Weizmannia acidilactici]
MEPTLKVINALSDPTRYSIYQFVLKKRGEVSVQEVANKFNIHPNVARLHLSKLEDVKVITSELNKTGKGGRPARLYKSSEQVVELTFPHREYKLLSNILLEALNKLKLASGELLQDIGRQYGKQIIENILKSMNKTKDQLTYDEKLSVLASVSTMDGYCIETSESDEANELDYHVYNCPFKELINHSTQVCEMHIAYIHGLFEALFDDFEMKQQETILHECSECIYHVKVAKVAN